MTCQPFITFKTLHIAPQISLSSFVIPLFCCMTFGPSLQAATDLLSSEVEAGVQAWGGCEQEEDGLGHFSGSLIPLFGPKKNQFQRAYVA